MDLYTKAVLTIIAVALSAIALQHAGVVPRLRRALKGRWRSLFVTVWGAAA